MRIGIASYDYDPPIGGLGIVVRQSRGALCTLYPEDTHVVISPSSGADERVSRVAAWFWKRRGGCPMFSFLLMFRLNVLIRKHQLDVLHVHAGSGGVFLLRKPSSPVVVTSHHTYLQESELVFLHQPLKRLWKRFMSFLERRTYALADRIVCVSRDTAEFLETRYHQQRSKITVIENAIAPCTPNPAVIKEPSTILFVGRLEERKGIWTLLHAMKTLTTTHPSARLRIVGSDLMSGAVTSFLQQHTLKDCVTLTGYKDDASMQRELASATVLVVPSLLEGFGLIAAQGMLAGTTVVASDAAGLRSVITDGKTGLLFRVGDSDDLARVLTIALDQPERRLRLETEAQRDALQRFDMGARARDLHQILSSL